MNREFLFKRRWKYFLGGCLAKSDRLIDWRLIYMKRIILMVAMVLGMFLPFSLPAIAADVTEGKCITYDSESKTITVEEYDTNFTKESPRGNPTGIISTFNCNGATVGIIPEPGDILRIAHESKGGVKKALKVMNVTKQDLMKK